MVATFKEVIMGSRRFSPLQVFGREKEGLLGYAQLALIGNFSIIAVISARYVESSVLPSVFAITGALVVLSVIAAVLPWRRIGRQWTIGVAVIDLLLILALRDVLFDYQRGLSVLAIIPVIWLAFQFDIGALVLAILGNFIVALYPYVREGSLPATPSDWGSVLMTSTTVCVIAIAVHAAALALRKQRTRLINVHQDLRASIRSGHDGAEKLRISVAAGASDAAALKVSVAFAMDGADKLRESVAEAMSAGEALKVSVAEGLDAASVALAIMDTVDAGITFFDADGMIVFSNETARTLSPALGTPRFGQSEANATPVTEMDRILASAAEGELVTRRAFWVRDGDRRRAMIASSQFVRRASGELLGIVVATHDVTPLADAIRSRDEFLETVSHELRTPLTSIIGYLEIMEERVPVPAVDAELAIVQRNSQRLLGLINDLLVEAEDEPSLECTITNVSDLAANVLNTIRPAAAEAGVSVKGVRGGPVHAEIDDARIGEVVEKLLSNALKFNREGGSIELDVGYDRNEVTIRIADTGIGIRDDDTLHIFERFFRGAAARENVIAGAGLGLSRAKLIVDAHRGTIVAESLEGRGTTMTVRLPLLSLG
jgi:signal transduction histidine kinase